LKEKKGEKIEKLKKKKRERERERERIEKKNAYEC
jgi:hypothetical protein